MSRLAKVLVSVSIVGVLVAGGGVRQANAQADSDVVRCAQTITKALADFGEKFYLAMATCESKRISNSRPSFCATDSRLRKDIESALKRLTRELQNCDDVALSNLCPLAARTPGALSGALLNGEQSVATRLQALVRNLFVEPTLDGCVRPGWDASREAEECAKIFSRDTAEVLEELQECFYDCELKQLKQNEPALCVEPSTGAPAAQKVNDCVDKEISGFFQTVERRCEAEGVRDLGCPLGQETPQATATGIAAEILQLVEHLNVQIFHSTCRQETDIVVPTAPSTVTRLPSGNRAYLVCGQTVDQSFMQGDTVLMLDAAINCDAVQAGVDGVLIAVSGITVDGRSLFGVTGPDRSRYRTGSGIRLLPGATDVTLQNLKSIRRFGVGISDSGTNDGLRIVNVALRRNDIAGISVTSPNVTIDNIYSDRNEIGISVEGDNIEVRNSVVRRSGGGRGLGVEVRGTDVDLDGTAVRFVSNFLEHNGTGVVVGGEGHLLLDSRITRSRYSGVEVEGSSNRIEECLIRDSRQGHGVELRGSANTVTGTISEKNGLAGFAVTGSANILKGNSAGDFRRGNGSKGGGYVATGSNNEFGSNEAYRNRPNEYAIGRDNIDLGGNTANSEAVSFDRGGILVE